jgi:hypothetical protein
MAKPTAEEKAAQLLADLEERIREARGVLGDLYTLKRDVEKDLTAKVHDVMGKAVEDGLQELAGEISNLREHIINGMESATRREIEALVKTVADSPYGQQLFGVAATIRAVANQPSPVGRRRELVVDMQTAEVPGTFTARRRKRR